MLIGESDWLLGRTDGALQLDVRLTLKTDDGELIGMTYRGVRHGPIEVIERLNRGDTVDASEYFFRTAAFFETSSAKYGWLNRMVAGATGHRPPAGLLSTFLKSSDPSLAYGPSGRGLCHRRMDTLDTDAKPDVCCGSKADLGAVMQDGPFMGREWNWPGSWCDLRFVPNPDVARDPVPPFVSQDRGPPMIRSNRPGTGKSSTRVFHVLLPAEAIGKLRLGPIARGTNMPLTVTYLNDNHGVMASASGELSAADLLDAVRRVNEFAVTTKPVCYTFFDFDGLTRISISIGDIARAADYAVEAAKLSDTERIVAIHANGEYAYRLALLYRAFIEETGWEARVFRERREAVSWLRGRAALKHGIIVEAV